VKPDPAAPLQDEVDEQLLGLVTAADAIGGGRRLYFHFSGHGAGSPDESGDDVALLLAKWSRSLARLALSTDEYRGVLGGMGLFEEIVIVAQLASSGVGPPEIARDVVTGAVTHDLPGPHRRDDGITVTDADVDAALQSGGADAGAVAVALRPARHP
jgi:hypothetical protein